MAQTEPAYDADGTVREALEVYFHAHGLGNGGYDQPYHFIKLWGFVPLILPNPPARKKALRRHDLNHVLGGFNARGGEGEVDIAAFEIGARGGCGSYWVAWAINIFFFALGVVIRPGHLFRAFVRSRRARNAYSLEVVEGAFLDQKLAKVRDELGIRTDPPSPIGSDRLAFSMWAAVALVAALAPVAALWTLVSAWR